MEGKLTGRADIINYIQRFVELDEQEQDVFANAFTLSSIKKRQFIVQPEFTAKYRHYVLNGAFRSYVICHQGQDHTISFAVDDWWISDYNSYVFQKPASMFVVALEDSVILKLDYEKEAELKASNPKFETFFRVIAERGLAHYQRRIIANLTLSAEERYDRFISKYPQIVQRVPQYALASYLGMTTEYLSRIRKKQTM